MEFGVHQSGVPSTILKKKSLGSSLSWTKLCDVREIQGNLIGCLEEWEKDGNSKPRIHLFIE